MVDEVTEQGTGCRVHFDVGCGIDCRALNRPNSYPRLCTRTSPVVSFTDLWLLDNLVVEEIGQYGFQFIIHLTFR